MMAFDPKIKIGDQLSNAELRVLFKCGNMGGMRRSKATGTLVIISDETKGLYKDVWKNGVLHYTGMGKNGDQVLDGNQNRTLYDSNINNVEVHLFEVLEKAIYTYRGIVKLIDKPYQAMQLDESGVMRKVWMFPLKPVADLDDLAEREMSDAEIIKLPNWRLIGLTETTGIDKIPKVSESTVYYRNAYLKELVKRFANGKCQLCNNNAPFIDNHGKPYLEEHHIIPLSEGGKDAIDNVVALCPNCHRKVHILKYKNDIDYLKRIAKENEQRYHSISTDMSQCNGVLY